MFKKHISELVPGPDSVNIEDSCTSGTGLRYFESLLVAVTLKVIGFKWLFYSYFISAAPDLPGIPKKFGMRQ